MNQNLQIQENNNNNLPIHHETIEQFKSLFYLFKGKRDTQVKLFNNNRTFTKQSILDLNRKVQEKLLLHNVPNSAVSISINLSKNRITTFGNWSEFNNERWDTSYETESIIINWDFEIVLPNRIHTIPQTHSLRVRLGREVKPSEFLHLLMIGSDEYELEESSSQMVCKIDFVNNTIANELLNQIEEWYNSLDENTDDNKLNKFFHKNEDWIYTFMEILIILSGFFLLYPILKFIFFNDKENNFNYQSLFFIVTYILFTSMVFNRLSLKLTSNMRRKASKLRGTPFFQITNGDRQALVKTNKKNKSIQNEIFWKLFISLTSSAILFFLGFLIKEILALLIK